MNRTTNNKVGIVYHPDFLKHRAYGYHPERPQRLEAIMDHLCTTGLLTQLQQIPFQTTEEKWLQTIHTSEYINLVEETSRKGYGILDIGDTYVNQYSYDTAKLAVGACLKAGDWVANGKVKSCFCCVRPPGHHAEADNARGFCLFNNIAITAKYLQNQHKIERIAIIDWDVHHGNSTQKSFYHDAGVFYFSIHEYPYFPGSGHAEEKGEGDGAGCTINVPLPAGSGDTSWLKAFERELIPAMEKFKPQILLLSIGFDNHRDDPLANMNVTDVGLISFSEITKEIAEQYCDGRLLSVLEGGYDLEVLARSVENHLRVLLQE